MPWVWLENLKRNLRTMSVKTIRRWFKLKYLQLFRAKGGPSKVAIGFGIGLAVEMFTLPTMGLAFFLIFPFAYFARASVPAALIGFVLGKVIYMPMAILNSKVGAMIIPESFFEYLEFLPTLIYEFVHGTLKLIVGGIIVGAALGLISYFPIRYLLEFYQDKRKEKRRLRKEKLTLQQE